MEYYNKYELNFYIDIVSSVLEEYQKKVEMLENLKDEFVTELEARRC